MNFFFLILLTKITKNNNKNQTNEIHFLILKTTKSEQTIFYSKGQEENN